MFQDGKNLSRRKVGLHFADFFIVRVKKVCYEVRGELLRSFFHFTRERLCPYVPTIGFRLMALWNQVECQCYNKIKIQPG